MNRIGNSESANRAADVDLLRCLGIVLMIMGHVGFGDIFDKYIHAFHMPLWFIISGFFINTDRTFVTYLYKRIKSLIIPYLVFGIIYEVLRSISGINQWAGLFYPNNIQIPFNGALWFLLAMFAADVISFIILKYLPGKVAYVFIVLIAWGG